MRGPKRNKKLPLTLSALKHRLYGNEKHQSVARSTDLLRNYRDAERASGDPGWKTRQVIGRMHSGKAATAGDPEIIDGKRFKSAWVGNAGSEERTRSRCGRLTPERNAI
ncbi:hypothetical protein GWI33_012111 [Rhynchophorus ferrugineus]|uniref:Uncharacterized protein n=1 Tax=Rhynchophorus ferrugineus TaxID=354439 RepID=A0A834MB43_RHYFE|nr:hypothetical protein GWI33_012111 [Rhynchophorus ferrugineus]